MTDLCDFGLTERFAALAAGYPDCTVGRVTSQEKELYRIVTADGEGAAAVSGKFRYHAGAVSDYPAVGDFVMIGAGTGDAGVAVIHAVLPRKSLFIRKAAGTGKTGQAVAANVDTLFLCMALNRDFNLRRLERYLSLAWDSGAAPVVLLTKADLADDLSARRAEAESVAPGVPLLVTSSVEENGVSQVLPYLQKGSSAALIGSSGIGKSTLINCLLGEERIATNTLRNDDKGRHTTTRRELFVLPGGGIVIDTPGMRELGIFEAGEGVSTAFSDVEALARQCRFKDCTHGSEPGCAVQAALRDGVLSAARYASFCKLSRESEFAAGSEGYLREKERKFKNIALLNKQRRDR